MVVSDAVENTQPWCTEIGNALKQSVNIKATRGTTAKDLFEFGRSLDEGMDSAGKPVHLGVVWGLEYGWLREKYPELKPLVICYQGSIGYGIHMMVREEDAAGIKKDLRNLHKKRLVVSRRSSLMNQIYLETEVRKVLKPGETVATFFSGITVCDSLQDAISELRKKRGERADCLVVDIASYDIFMEGRRNIGLSPVLTSSPFPLQVVVGRPEHLRKLSKGLWDKAQDKILESQHDERGNTCGGFWGFDRFVAPHDDEANGFEEMLIDGVRTYKASTLKELELSELLDRQPR